MRAPEDCFQDWKGRRRGILRALTTEVDKFWEVCDPSQENLCLYGLPDGSWAVDLPADEVPPEMPEPALGINFSRAGMERKAWLSLVAVHSDAWLMAVAFYNGARLTREGRAHLFELMNELPTCFEIVSGKATVGGNKNVVPAKKRQAPPLARPPAAEPRYRQSVPHHRTSSRPNRGRQEFDDEDEEVSEDEEGSAYQDGEGDPCPNCGRVYRTGDFWIQCDFCDTWYDGKCVQMTPTKAQRMGKWRCPACDRRMH
jgi:hypothetical protein